MEKNQEITHCCICTDQFKDLRILSCIHTFCLGCLEKTATQRELKSGDTMGCPICPKPFVIPEKGMAALQKNFFMENLIEVSKISEQQRNVVLCDKCKSFKEKDEKEIPKAVEFCIHCQQNICNRCRQEHERYRELRNHQFIEIGNPLKDELLRKVSLQYCELHNKKEMEMFCADCEQLTCTKCLGQKHKLHNCSDIAEIAEKFRKQISSDLFQMKLCSREASAKIQQVVAMQTDFQKNIADIEKAIIDRSNELKTLVDRHTRSLLDELAAIKQRESKQMASYKEESETHKMVIESFKTYCMQLVNKGSDAEICRSAKDLHLRAEELQGNHQKQIGQPFPWTEIYFESSNVKDFLKKSNILGRVECVPVVPIQYSGNLDIPSSSMVYGVTKQENRIYVLCQSPDLIHVFEDDTEYARLQEIKIEEIEHPVDIGYCTKSKCLYVLDDQLHNFLLENYGIWKITPDDHRVTKWLNIAHSGRFRLSVTSKGHVLVIIGGPSLEIYGSDARLIRRIPIPGNLYQPRQIIEKANGDYIISHVLCNYTSFDAGRRWVISRLSSDGKTILSQFALKDKLENFGLIQRCHFALDADNDRLFVVDVFNHRVILLDANSLNRIQVLSMKDRNTSNQSSRLFYDEKKKQLVVGRQGGKVDICEVKEKTAAACLVKQLE